MTGMQPYMCSEENYQKSHPNSSGSSPSLFNIQLPKHMYFYISSLLKYFYLHPFLNSSEIFTCKILSQSKQNIQKKSFRNRLRLFENKNGVIDRYVFTT